MEGGGRCGTPGIRAWLGPLPHESSPGESRNSELENAYNLPYCLVDSVDPLSSKLPQALSHFWVEVVMQRLSFLRSIPVLTIACGLTCALLSAPCCAGDTGAAPPT